MRKIRLRLAAILFFLAAAATAAGEAVADPLARDLRLNLWGGSLSETVREIQSQTGVEVKFHLSDFPSLVSGDDVYIITGRVSLGTVMEGLARRFSFRYRVAESGRVEVSRGYGWERSTPALKSLYLNPLTEDGDPEATRAFLGELVKPMDLLDGDFYIKMERHPRPENPGHLRATVALPPILADYLERAVLCLSGDPGDYPPAPGGQRNLFAVARDYSEHWETLLDRRVAPPGTSDIKAILNGVANDAGMAIILTAPPGIDGTQLSGANERRPLRTIAAELSSEWGLGRRVFLSCGALLFEAGAGLEVETDARSRELFWSGLAVAGFDARRAAEQVNGGKALAALLRSEIYPWVWRDPMCALLYSPATGRLVAIAPLNVVRAVADRLARIR